MRTFTILATVAAVAVAQVVLPTAPKQGEAGYIDNNLSIVMKGEKDAAGALELTATIYLTNQAYTTASTAVNPFVMIQWLPEGVSAPAKDQDAIFCHIPAFSSTGMTTTAKVEEGNFWACFDFNSVDGVQTNNVIDEAAKLSNPTVVDKNIKSQTTTSVSAVFTVKRKYDATAASGDFAIKDGAKVNYQWLTGMTTRAASPAAATATRTGLASTQLNVVNPVKSNAIVNFAASMLAFVGLVAYAF